TAQVRAALHGVPDDAAVLLAYEPVWAIGEGGTPATPDDVAPVVEAIAHEAGPRRAVLYGGSVSLDNAAALLEVPGIGGLFVGRAAWQVEGFLAIVETAAGAARRREPCRRSTDTSTRPARTEAAHSSVGARTPRTANPQRGPRP